MMQTMSAVEYNEWLAYYDTEPFGPEADEMRLARLLSLIAEINRDEKKRKEPFTAEEMMLESMRQPVEAVEEDEIEAKEKELALARKTASILGVKVPGL
jgi:hypothetical protein